MPYLRHFFAIRLKELRRRSGMTQEELADATGLSVGFIRSLEQAINAPSFESLELLARALGIEIKEFFDFDKGT